MAELRYFSHSRCDTDNTCERQRYLQSEWGGTGLTPIRDGWDLTYGSLIHEALEQLAKTGSVDYAATRKAVQAAATEFGHPMPLAKDYGALAEGHLRGFVKAVWPRWMAEYEIVETERLRSWDAGMLPTSAGVDKWIEIFRFRYRQDLLLRNKFDGSFVMVDYKTTADDSPKWIASWAKHPQLHSSAYAMKQQGIDLNYMLIQGLYKGWKDKKTGGPGSIFCKGWVNREYSMSPEYSYEYKRSKGWEPFATAEEFDDLEDWVNSMPQQILTAQFPQTGPISPREDIGAAWFRQQLMREAEVAEAMHELGQAEDEPQVQLTLDKHFKQNFTKCQPAFGYECPMKDICWVPTVGADPLGSNLFKRREAQFEDGAENAT